MVPGVIYEQHCEKTSEKQRCKSDIYIHFVYRFRVLSSSGSRDFDVQTTHQRLALKANLLDVHVVLLFLFMCMKASILILPAS